MVGRAKDVFVSLVSYIPRTTNLRRTQVRRIYYYYQIVLNFSCCAWHFILSRAACRALLIIQLKVKLKVINLMIKLKRIFEKSGFTDPIWKLLGSAARKATTRSFPRFVVGASWGKVDMWAVLYNAACA